MKTTESVQTTCQYKVLASHLAVLYKTPCFKGKGQEWKIPVASGYSEHSLSKHISVFVMSMKQEGWSMTCVSRL